MSTGSVPGLLRRPLRLSGFAACAATVLFTVAGTSYLATVDDPPTFRAQSWTAGAAIPIENREAMILWGVGLDGTADEVTCTVSGSRFEDGPLPAGPGPEHASLTTAEVDGEPLTYLARVRYIREGTVTCDGPGLAAVRVSEDLRPGLARGSAIAFYVGAVAAALWAVVTLRITRPRRSD